jgi:hypothetical protein
VGAFGDLDPPGPATALSLATLGVSGPIALTACKNFYLREDEIFPHCYNRSAG